MNDVVKMMIGREIGERYPQRDCKIGGVMLDVQNLACPGVFAHNDEMALGAVEAIGSRKIIVVGFDATDDAQVTVKAGKMAATVAQKPDLMGATAVETAQKILNGETVDKEIPVEVELITK